MFNFEEVFGFKFSGYLTSLFSLSGLILMGLAPRLWNKGLKSESKIAFWSGRIYLIGSITLYLLLRFLE